MNETVGVRIVSLQNNHGVADVMLSDENTVRVTFSYSETMTAAQMMLAALKQAKQDYDLLTSRLSLEISEREARLP